MLQTEEYMYTVKILRERTVIVIKELHRHHHIVCLPRKKMQDTKLV